MPRIRKQIRQMMNDMDARAARVRPGSVLILVVVLLVLMALLGTAYLVTSRNERVATRLFSHNVQIDMLVKGVENMAIASLSDTSYQTSDVQHYDDLYTTASTRLAYTTPTANFPTQKLAVNHDWLASRTPGYLGDNIGYPAGTAPTQFPKGVVVAFNGALMLSLADNNPAPTVSGSQWIDAGALGNQTQFPAWTAVSAPLAARTYNEDPRYPAISARPDGVRTCVIPTYVPINGTNYPALHYLNPSTRQMETALAASASGNGIADAFLWRLPIGTLDGITYYAAVRIIDNNSAININTANSSSNEFDLNGNAFANPGFFPGIFNAGVGLAELTNSFNASNVSNDQNISMELQYLNNYRFHTSGGQHPSQVPYDDSGVPRGDFNFLSVGDVLHMQLGRRLANPGYSTSNLLFRAFSQTDSAALAYRFDLPNRYSSPTMAEQTLVTSTWDNSMSANAAGISSARPGFRSTPWDPAQTGTWFQQYLDELPPGNTGAFTQPTNLNRRAFFTTHNAINNRMPGHALTAQTTMLPADQLASVLRYMLPASPDPANINYATGNAPKVSLNTAPVSAFDASASARGPTLWYGFYQAMLDVLPIDDSLPNAVRRSPYAYLDMGRSQGAGVFRSPIRNLNGFEETYLNPTSGYLQGPETVLLRSLIAAVNAKDLRDSGDNVEFCHIPEFPAGKMGGVVNMYAYGTERQVFITEVYANTEVVAPAFVGAAQTTRNPNAGMKNPKGYVAVELYNPYDYAVDMTWWTLGVVTRKISGTGQAVSIAPISGFLGFNYDGDPQGPKAVIPPHGFLVLENLPATKTANPNDATYRPYIAYKPAPNVPGGNNSYYVANLDEVIPQSGEKSHELVVLRQIYAHGHSTTDINTVDPGTFATNASALLTNLANFPCVDSFDFGGMKPGGEAEGSPLQAIHYTRANPGAFSGTRSTAWKFVYPGKWNSTSIPAPFLQDGVLHSDWFAPKDPTTKVTTTSPGPQPQFDRWADKLDATPAGPGDVINLGAGDLNSTYRNVYPAIQLNNTDMGGPNKMLTTQTPYRFPFGGFARVGDVLQVPFIGAYTIMDSTGANLIEINPVTRDAGVCNDWDSNIPLTTKDDAFEQIGRFCPLLSAMRSFDNTETQVISPDQFIPSPPASFTSTRDPYGWACHVMDYFSVLQNPNDDYLPNVDPIAYNSGSWDMSQLLYMNRSGKAGAPGSNPIPMAVANTLNAGTNINDSKEDGVPVEGLININTASWRTLAAVPWVPTSTPQNIQLNQQIAQSIVRYRNAYGAFKTLFDLNYVPLVAFNGTPLRIGTGNTSTFQSFYGDPFATDYGPAAGDISPLWSNGVPPGDFGSDGVMNDFETRFAMITRVSNLLTTRSDTYTVYVLVQGWSGVGTQTPQLVVQRRGAFIADRSQTTASNPTIHPTPIQTN